VLVGTRGLRLEEVEDHPSRRVERHRAGVDLQVVVTGIVHVALVIPLQVMLPVAIPPPDIRGRFRNR